ncbi:hypothetical protein [uncultured Methanobrevibacter sp.]|uniref:hypothetical protein n=1 Tax=uncultured Methanobrevibacter sp. TaxID=253161 RepID=UPI002612F39C|nr:hypothetical protein [uncultured Methanobrevibacter sp.]
MKIKRKVTEEDIVGLIKRKLPYNSVEIKKRGSKGLKWFDLMYIKSFDYDFDQD